MSKYLTTPEAAAYLSDRIGIRINRARLDTWRSREKGPHYIKQHGRVFYKIEDLDCWLEENSGWVSSYMPRDVEWRMEGDAASFEENHIGANALVIAITNSNYPLNQQFQNLDETAKYNSLMRLCEALAGKFKMYKKMPHITKQDARDVCMGAFANEEDAFKFIRHMGLLPNSNLIEREDAENCLLNGEEEDLTPPADLNPDLLFTR